MLCPKCGLQNSKYEQTCMICGEPLTPDSTPVPPYEPSNEASLIEDTNKPQIETDVQDLRIEKRKRRYNKRKIYVFLIFIAVFIFSIWAIGKAFSNTGNGTTPSNRAIAISQFTPPTAINQGKGYDLSGVLTAKDPLTEVTVSLLENGQSKLAGKVEWEGESGPTTYNFNDETKNLNQLVAFNKLSVGDKQIIITASTSKGDTTILGNWPFKIVDRGFYYKSQLDAKAYPTLKPEKWGEWIEAVQGANANIDPVFAGRLAALAKSKGKKITYLSGFRTYEKQNELYKLYKSGRGNLAGSPGGSWHEFGAAIDVAEWAKDIPDSQMRKFGLCKPIASENWHVQPIEVSGKNKTAFYNAYSNAKYPKWSEDCYMIID